MFKYLFGVLLGIRNVFQALAAKLINRFRDPKTGKFIGINPKTVSFLIWATGLVFFFIVITSRILTRSDVSSNGEELFNKEMTPKLGINLLPPEFEKKEYGEDEIDDADLLLQGEQSKESSEKEGLSSKTEDGKPSKEDCDSLLAKMQLGEDLSSSEKYTINACLKENISGLSDEKLQFAKALISDDISDDEKIILTKALSGEATPEELVLAKALSSKDENLKKLTREAIKDPELREAFAKQLLGNPIKENERQLLADSFGEDFESKINLSGSDAINSGSDSLGANGFSDGESGSDGTKGKGGSNGVDGKAGSNGTKGNDLSSKQLTALAEEAKIRAEKISELEEELAEAQAAAAEAGAKIAKGEALTETEQDSISTLSKVQNQMKKEKDILEKQKSVLYEKSKLLQSTLTEVASKLEEVIPSGLMEEYEEDEIEITQPQGGKNNLSPEKMKLVSLNRKKQIEFKLKEEVDKLKEKLIKEENEERAKLSEAKNVRDNTNNSILGGAEALDLSAAAQNGQVASIDQSVVFSNKSLKAFNLTPDMKIPAALMTPILISDKGKAQIVKVKILSDVFEPESNRLVIPKGSIAVGTTQGFDADTGVMDLSFDKVSLGSGKIAAIGFSVGSADGTFGLKGEVRDTRGKLLLGAFVSSFSAGALSWFSNSIVQPFLTSTSGTDALLGAGLGGAAEVANRISEMFAGDLQNSAKIFWCPKVPLVLFPQ